MKHDINELRKITIALIIVSVLTIALAIVGIHIGFEKKVNLIEKTK